MRASQFISAMRAKGLMSMSEEGGLTLGELAVYFFGVVLLILGLMLTYFSFRAEVGLVSPRTLTPVGIAISLIGGFMLLARGSES